MLYLTLRRAKTGNNRATRSSIEYGSGVQPGLENGVVLRERRESMGVTIDEVESATKIRHKYLSALEADDWQLLPGEIVGRGFLRNYASFLDLDPNEMLERRRALADAGLARILRDTSAVSPLPPERQVDYRPKEVDLKDEPEGLDEIASQQRRRRRSSPFIGWLLLAGLLLGLLFWQASNIGSLFGAIANGVQSGVASIFASDPVIVSGDVSFTGGEQAAGEQADGSSVNSEAADGQTVVVGQVDPNNAEGGQSASGQVAADGSTDGAVDSGSGDGSGSSNDGSTNGGSSNGGSTNDGASDVAAVPAAADTAVPAPTALPPTSIPTEVPPTAVPPTEVLPTPVPPTDVPPTPVPPTPVPLPPTPVPVPPTPVRLPPTPVPEPVVAAPSCPDPRSLLTSPGVNEIVSGSVPIVGSATHEAFHYYKLEFAPGANAAGGYNYFDGTEGQISNGRLGQLNTAAIPNGVYTIRLTTVDLTANFPPPCMVTIQVEN